MTNGIVISVEILLYLGAFWCDGEEQNRYLKMEGVFEESMIVRGRETVKCGRMGKWKECNSARAESLFAFPNSADYLGIMNAPIVFLICPNAPAHSRPETLLMKSTRQTTYAQRTAWIGRIKNRTSNDLSNRLHHLRYLSAATKCSYRCS